MNTQSVHIDAGKFQKQLIQLAETVAQKVKREASSLLPGVPAFVSFDLHILTRQAMHTYDLFFYLNADERREKDCYWRPAFLARGASTCGRLAGWQGGVTRGETLSGAGRFRSAKVLRENLTRPFRAVRVAVRVCPALDRLSTTYMPPTSSKSL